MADVSDLRASVLACAIAHLGMLEDKGRNNHGPIVRLALRGAVRVGKPLGIVEGVAWCAGFAGLCLFDGPDPFAAALAWTPDRYAVGDAPQPVGWRAAVWEIVVDAVKTGSFFGANAAEEPLSGDLIICGRNGQDPRHPGQEGHVAVLRERTEDGGFLCVGGNEADPTGHEPDGVRESLRRWDDPREPIVGFVRVQPSAAFLARAALDVKQR